MRQVGAMRGLYQFFTAVFVLGCCALGCGPALAFDAGTVAAIEKAADAFVTLAGDSANTGNAPRQTDPAAKPLLDRVFDTSEIQHGVQPVSELTDLGKWALAVVKVGTVYTLAGSGMATLDAVPNDPAIIAKLNHNAVVFAPEMGRYSDAAVWVEGATIDTVALFLSKASQADLDRSKNGVARIRTGVSQSLHGVITMLPTNGIADQWRRDRLAVLAVIAPRAAKFLLPEDLRQLSETAKAVAAQMTDPDVKSTLIQIATILMR
jgi:hypothetical protein